MRFVLTLTKPISSARSRKHCRHMCKWYLRIMAPWLAVQRDKQKRKWVNRTENKTKRYIDDVPHTRQRRAPLEPKTFLGCALIKALAPIVLFCQRRISIKRKFEWSEKIPKRCFKSQFVDHSNYNSVSSGVFSPNGYPSNQELKWHAKEARNKENNVPKQVFDGKSLWSPAHRSFFSQQPRARERGASENTPFRAFVCSRPRSPPEQRIILKLLNQKSSADSQNIAIGL